MFTCDAVDLDYLDKAPLRLDASINVDRPPSEVFAAFAHDPANWGEFFPGFAKAGRFDTPTPHGVGSRYWKRFLGVKIDEAVLVWDEGARLAFRVDATSAPAFHAWVEVAGSLPLKSEILCVRTPLVELRKFSEILRERGFFYTCRVA